VRIHAVTNDLRSDENDQFGPGQAVGAVRREGVAPGSPGADQGMGCRYYRVPAAR
jgi:hypothetical protein